MFGFDVLGFIVGLQCDINKEDSQEMGCKVWQKFIYQEWIGLGQGAKWGW